MSSFEIIIDKRSSVREFINKKISKDTLIKIITDGTKAPSGMNTQPWFFYVINIKKELDFVKELVRKYTNSKKNTFYYNLGNCQAIIFICGDKKELSVKKHKNSILLSIGACTENILLSTCNQNLGACWIGHFNNIEKELRNKLDIAEEKTIIASVILGYSLNKKQLRTPRKDIKEVSKFLNIK
jgi:nitroreductase